MSYAGKLKPINDKTTWVESWVHQQGRIDLANNNSMLAAFSIPAASTTFISAFYPQQLSRNGSCFFYPQPPALWRVFERTFFFAYFCPWGYLFLVLKYTHHSILFYV
jgi:hypothetical protein